MGIVVKGGYTYDQDTHLTLANDSVSFSDNGSSAYRLRRSRRDLALLDSHGNSLLTLRHKMVSLRGRWEGYVDGSKRIFSVRRSSVIGGSDFIAKVYGNPLAGKFEIEGSFEQRRFIVYDAGRSRSEVAEVKLGGEGVFSISVKAGFDSAFSTALVVLLVEIDGDAA